MGLAFKTIGIIARSHDPRISETLVAVMTYCLQHKVTLITDPHTRQLCQPAIPSIAAIPREQLGARCDLLICVGGDGNLLHASHLAIAHDTPVLGVNRGRLGFLTDIQPQELSKIGDILAGRYISEKRTVLRAQIVRDAQVIHEEIALNDAVVHPGKVAHMLEYEIIINNEFVCSLRADGLIVSTPTGSTAYALSADGPIIHPKLNAFLLVPMFPHTLTNRPIVIDHDVELDIVLADHHDELDFVARFSCDGFPETILKAKDSIQIRKHPKSLELIHPHDYSYFASLRGKLRWGIKSDSHE